MVEKDYFLTSWRADFQYTASLVLQKKIEFVKNPPDFSKESGMSSLVPLNDKQKTWKRRTIYKPVRQLISGIQLPLHFDSVSISQST